MSNDNNEQTSITFYISIISGFLLTISEILPYIRTVKANGIIHSITNFLIEKSIVSDENTQNTDHNEETQPLINNSQVLDKRQSTTTHLLSEVSNVTITSQSVNFTFHSPNVKLDFNESSN